MSSGRPGDADMAEHRAALLGEPGHVDHAAALAFEMRGHAEDGADRDDAGAADAVDDRRPAISSSGNGDGSGTPCSGSAGAGDALGLADLGAMHGDEGRAEAVDAGEILVAARLVDPALAAELGLDRLDRDAVRLHAAIAAALADQFVDDDALVGIGIGAALAAAALFGRAGLVVDQHRDALDLAQLRAGPGRGRRDDGSSRRPGTERRRRTCPARRRRPRCARRPRRAPARRSCRR